MVVFSTFSAEGLAGDKNIRQVFDLTFTDLALPAPKVVVLLLENCSLLAFGGFLRVGETPSGNNQW